MSQFEKITGNKRQMVFEGLSTGKTLVRLTLPSSEYEGLTVITQTLELNGAPAFQIDPPKGLFEEIARTKSTRLRFEFNSMDHVTHRFESDLRGATSNSLTLAFPDVIHRHQQRNNFRVKLLASAHATVCIGDIEIRMEIDNISMGGVYCLCRNKHKGLFEENLKLSDMDLYLTLKDECFIVPIRKIEVRRLEVEPKPRYFGVAFQFIKINHDAQKRLVHQIYELQREFLKNRLKMNDLPNI